MIVDDDLYARIRIKTELRLEQDGFLVDKEAVSGPEALEKIKADPPDIVLTDMKMPGMSGVAFIEELHRIHPEIPVVALSGYDDYEYVRASLKLGAVDYLLKHEMSRETVLEALHKCVERLQLLAESGRFRQEEARELEQAADRRQEILRMLRGDCTGLHVPVFQGKNGTLQLIVMQIDHVRRIEKENGKLELLMMIPVILSLLQQTVERCVSGVVESTGEGQFVILASFEGMYSQQYIWNIRHKMIQSLRKNLEKYTSLTASFAVGRVAHRPQELAECYRQACRELSLSYLTGDNSLLSVSPEPRGGSSDELFTLRPEDEREIAAAVEARDRDACLAAVSGVFESLMRVEANRTSCQVVCMELLNLVVRSTRELPLSEPLQSFCAKRKGDVLENDSVQESRLQILEAYERLFDFLEQNAPIFSYNRNTVNAIAYIRSHYQEDISLDEVAGKLNLNKSYLSRIFSHDCGKSFTEYVSFYRVEQAKRLLDEGLPIGEVAEKVGIANPSYFFRVFKSCEGVTPKTYVKMSKKCSNVK